jgi:hypothetical protein
VQVATLHAGNIRHLDDLNPVPLKGKQGNAIATAECEVRFAGWAKIFFHSEVQLHGAAGEPAASTNCEFRWLRQFAHSENLTEKAPSLRLLATEAWPVERDRLQ